MSTSTPSSPFTFPEFRAFLQLRLLVAMGWHMQAFVVGLYVYSLTKSEFILGMVSLAEALPAIGAALPMGGFVDRMDKRKAVRIAAATIIASGIGTALLLQDFTLVHLGKSAVLAGLFLMVAVNGTARAMYSPAMFTMLGQIIPRDMIPKAAATSSSVWQTAVIAGPLVAGLVYAMWGVPATAATFVVFMIVGASGSLRLTPKPPAPNTQKLPMVEELSQGLRFIFNNKPILGALSLDMFAVLFGGVISMLPAIADKILHTNAFGLGWLRAAMSIGSVVTMAWMSTRPPKKGAGRKMLWCVAGYGACIVMFAWSEWYWLSFATLIIAGAFDSVSVVIRSTILQLNTPENMKGRVAAANTMFITSSNEIGGFESGVAARLMGLVPSIYFGGVMTLVIVATVAWRLPELRKMEIE